MTDEFLQAASGLADFFAGLPDDHVMLELSDILAELEAGLAEKLAVAKDDVIPQYHRAGLKKCEAIEATTHTTKTPIATRPTCLDIRSILACKTSASTEALSVVCSLACSKVPDLSADQRVGSMIYTFAIPQHTA